MLSVFNLVNLLCKLYVYMLNGKMHGRPYLPHFECLP